MQQKFQFYNKNLKVFPKVGKLVMATLDLTVCILWQWTQHSTLLPFFFCDNFIDSSTFCTWWKSELFSFLDLDKGRHIHFACIKSLNKLRNDKVSQINIFKNELDNSDRTNILWVFLLIFILHPSYHQTHIAD